MNGRANGRGVSPAGLERSARLLKPGDYNRVFKRNFRSRDRYFTVLAARNEQPHARLGMAVARKASGNAVRRNRLKRVIRESFRLHRWGLPKVDIVVMVQPGAGLVASATLFDSLAKHWQNVNNKCAR